MQTTLISFPNEQGETLRGVLTKPESGTQSLTIFLHGFERCASTEKKCKVLADRLGQEMQAGLRLDFSGAGLSDGDFATTSIHKQAAELKSAVQRVNQHLGALQINVVAHSLGACALAESLEEIGQQLQKIVLLAPALNQKELLRYRFVTSQMKKEHPEATVTRDNYQEFLDEEKFMSDCQRQDKMSKRNYIHAEYFLEGQMTDLTEVMQASPVPFLHVHGDHDVAVPRQSVQDLAEEPLIVQGGDHDMERPDQMDQWVDRVVDFFIEK